MTIRGVRPYITGMNEDRDVAVRTDFPGDLHWYDLPDDEAELELEERPSASRRPWCAGRRPRRSLTPPRRDGNVQRKVIVRAQPRPVA